LDEYQQISVEVQRLQAQLQVVQQAAAQKSSQDVPMAEAIKSLIAGRLSKPKESIPPELDKHLEAVVEALSQVEKEQHAAKAVQEDKQEPANGEGKPKENDLQQPKEEQSQAEAAQPPAGSSPAPVGEPPSAAGAEAPGAAASSEDAQMAEARKGALDQLQEANKSLAAAGLSSEDAAKRLKVAAEKAATETTETALPKQHS
jgi:hypothetical protein